MTNLIFQAVLKGLTAPENMVPHVPVKLLILKDHNEWFLFIREKRTAIYTPPMVLSTLILTFNSDLEKMLFPRPQQYLHLADIVTGYHFIKLIQSSAIHVPAALLNQAPGRSRRVSQANTMEQFETWDAIFKIIQAHLGLRNRFII